MRLDYSPDFSAKSKPETQPDAPSEAQPGTQLNAQSETSPRRRLYAKLSAPLLAAIGAGLFMAVLFASYMLSTGLLNKREGIALPSTVKHTPIVSSDGQIFTTQSVAEIPITTQNVLAVIASLKRPDAYSCQIENTLYYGNDSSTDSDESTSLYCRQYVRGNTVRIDMVSSVGSIQSTLLRKGTRFYAWMPGDGTPYEGRWGEFNDDAAAMLPTYEELLTGQAAILSANSTIIENEPSIQVEAEQAGYRFVYRISAVTGLLQQAAYYDEADTLRRLVQITELDTNPPADTIFMLPDGTQIGDGS